MSFLPQFSPSSSLCDCLSAGMVEMRLELLKGSRREIPPQTFRGCSHSTLKQINSPVHAPPSVCLDRTVKCKSFLDDCFH